VDGQPKYQRRRIGEILVEHGWLTPEGLEAALAAQREEHRNLGSILVEMGLITRGQLARALAEQRRDIPEVPPQDLRNVRPDMAAYIPETLARRFNAVAVRRAEDGSDTLHVAMEDPTDLEALDLLSHVTRMTIEPLRGAAGEITAAIERLYGQQLHGEEAAASLEEVSLEVERADAPFESEPAAPDLMASAEETPVVRFVEVLFREAVSKQASDVHIEPGEQTTNVRLRIDGVLHRLLTLSRRMHPAVVSRIKIVSGLNIAERRLPQDGRCRLKLRDHEVDVRVSTLPTVHGEKVVMRLLDKSQALLDLNGLGFDEEDLARYTEALQANYGIILLSGPTGSGKTTTLYCGLRFLNQPTRNIVTVEDPVEYELPGVGQVQIKPEIGLTFARCLRHILRQDPNVIMVGEMRDLETTQIAIRAALTGHLVLSTLHANNAPAVVSRLADIGVPAYLITAALNLAVAQRLVRRLCPECRERYDPPDEVLQRLGEGLSRESGAFYRAAGCEACDYTGYHGRVGLFEVMPLSTTLKRMIQKECSEVELRDQARREGMKTLHEQGLRKVLAGITTIEEVLTVPAEQTLDEDRPAPATLEG